MKNSSAWLSMDAKVENRSAHFSAAWTQFTGPGKYL